MGAEPAIPFADLAHQRDPLSDEIAAAIARVIDASDYILGAELEAFEREFAAYCGIEHAVGVGSGTAALALGLEALGIGRGDEVIVPAHTYVSSALAVAHAGAEPVFCEVSERTGLIDAEAATGAVGERTAAVMPVHLYGQACDMSAIEELAASRGLAVIEDAAQAHGARWDGRRVGSFGALAAFSFYPTKNLGALGDAGAVLSADPGVIDRTRLLRMYGWRTRYASETHSTVSRMDELQAAVLTAKLGHLDEWNATRKRIAQRYRANLDGAVELPPPDGVFHLFVVRTSHRDQVQAHLAGHGVGTDIHYPLPVHLQPAYAQYGDGQGSLPVTERLAREVLSLPIYPELSDDSIDYVCQALRMYGA